MLGKLRLIDLSVSLEHQAASEPVPAKIRYIRHAGEGLQQMQQFFGVRPEDLVYSNGLGWAVEEVQAITHTGTHVDAPYHYGPTSEGKPARTIDQIPLEWCFAPGVILDVRHKAAGEFISVSDLQDALTRIDYQLRPLDIVLLHTGADKRLGSPGYFAQTGLGREGVLWLIERGVKVIGIDAYTLDRPFANMVADYQRTGDGRFIWPAHFAGIEREYCQIEKLANLDQLSRSHGFYVSCLPVKIQGASAGWCRAIALVPEEQTVADNFVWEAAGDWGDKLAGVILGTAVGDALGLPREGLLRKRATKLFGDPPLRHAFLFGRGMVSDDTEHTCMTGQALLRAPEDADAFARSLAWRLRFWLLGLPAGTGRATLRAIVKLWLGFPPAHSGVWSAGNGPAMRAALLGVCLGHDRNRLRAYVRVSTRLTHTDPRAERGAFLVALAAHFGAVRGPQCVRGETFLEEVREALPDADDELRSLLGQLEDHLRRDSSAVELANALGLDRGISGYVYHTVALALYCWLRHRGNYRQAVEEVIALGGDADSTGAIVGGLAGATLGTGGIPVEWLHGLWEWPRSVAWMQRLAQRLSWQFPVVGSPVRQEPLPLLWPGLILRNLFFLSAVLGHGLRRLLPPY